MFLKECKYVEKGMKHIYHNFSDFAFSDESDEEWQVNVFRESNFEKANSIFFPFFFF